MPDATYPLLRRRKRRRGLRLPRITIGRRTRIAAVLLLALGIVGSAVVYATRPVPPTARQSLANSLTTLAAGNYSAARNHAIAALKAQPDAAIAHVVLARALLALGDGISAEGELGRARDDGYPAAALHHLQAHARLLQDDFDGAIDEAGRTQSRYAPYATRIRALALAKLDDTAGARDALEPLIAAHPNDAPALVALGRIRFTAGDVGGAAQAAAAAVGLTPREPAALTLQGEIVRSRYGLVAALPWFEAALRTDAFYHPALIEYAASLGDAGHYADMLAVARRAEQARPGSPQALYLEAVLAARAGRPDLARALLTYANGALDDIPGAVLLSGGLDYAQGKYEQAVAKWRELIVTQPLNVTVRRLMGAALLRSGDPRGALDMLRPIGVRGDADSYALGLIARAGEAVGDRAFATDFVDRADGGRRMPAAAFATDDSLATLVASAAEDGDDPSYAIGVIRGLVESGNTAAAIAKGRVLVAASPGAPAAQLALGDAFAAAGRYAEAAPVYARAANLAFDEPTMLRLVDALGRANRARDAAAALALYTAQNPQSLAGQRLLGHWQAASGEWDTAIETLEGIRARIGNRDPAVLADLAIAYAGAGDGEIARAYGKAAYALVPMNAAVADAYGVALAADGDTAGARQLLQKAVLLAPGDGAIAGHLKQLG